jgi:hypothetical protein
MTKFQRLRFRTLLRAGVVAVTKWNAFPIRNGSPTNESRFHPGGVDRDRFEVVLGPAATWLHDALPGGAATRQRGDTSTSGPGSATWHRSAANALIKWAAR